MCHYPCNLSAPIKHCHVSISSISHETLTLISTIMTATPRQLPLTPATASPCSSLCACSRLHHLPHASFAPPRRIHRACDALTSHHRSLPEKNQAQQQPPPRRPPSLQQTASSSSSRPSHGSPIQPSISQHHHHAGNHTTFTPSLQIGTTSNTAATSLQLRATAPSLPRARSAHTGVHHCPENQNSS